MHCYRLQKQNGIALLMAMLVVTIATVTAVSLVHEQSISFRKTSHIESSNTSLMYSLVLEDYARLYLQKDHKDSKIDHLSEDWASGIDVLPIGRGYFSGFMEDAQSKININSVLAKENEDRLKILCNNLEVSPDFIPALKDWLDTDQDTTDAEGAEDVYYTALEQPYRAGNRIMSDVSELLLVKGVDNEMFGKLKPFITVLPSDAGLNINTISSEVYKTLGTNLDADKFMDERGKDPFSSLEDYKNRLGHTLPDKGVAVKTDYFHANGQVILDEKTLFISTLIYRNNNGGTQILSRRLGEF